MGTRASTSTGCTSASSDVADVGMWSPQMSQPCSSTWLCASTCAFDLTHGIAIAEQSGAIVITTTPPAMIVPPGADVPPTMAEFGDIERVERPGGTVRICTLSDEWAAGMMAQVSA